MDQGRQVCDTHTAFEVFMSCKVTGYLRKTTNLTLCFCKMPVFHKQKIDFSCINFSLSNCQNICGLLDKISETIREKVLNRTSLQWDIL